ncbi:MAG: Killer protein [Gammaproteobacteria bacterium]|nr:Killer protein [Gammaproteobacteria bacterium]
MIKTWKHKGLKLFYETGSTAKIQAKHASKIHDILQLLDAATSAKQMNLPGLAFHVLTGDMAGHYALKVNANWRITFQFEDEDAILVDYVDYH